MSYFRPSLKPKVVSLDTINVNVRDLKYEVRGEIYLAAVKRKNAGKEGKTELCMHRCE